MPSERTVYEFPDGKRETHQPAKLPEVGDRFRRFGREWEVIEVYDRGDVMIVTLLHTAHDGDRNGSESGTAV